jgi:hypothetical protein
MTKNSFEKSLLLSQYNFRSTWSPFTIIEIEKSLGTGELLPGGAKSFYQNSSDVISLQEFSNFITFYPNCATIFNFLSAGSGFADCQGNCPVGSSKPRYFSLNKNNNSIVPLNNNLKFDKESSFNLISKITKFEPSQIATIWTNFQKMKIQNKFDRPAFDKYFHVLPSEGLRNRLFDFFDLNKSGVINYKEVCYCLSFVVNRGLEFVYYLVKNSIEQELTLEDKRLFYTLMAKDPPTSDQELNEKIPSNFTNFQIIQKQNYKYW